MPAKNASSFGNSDGVVVLEQEFAIASSDVRCITAQNTADNDQLDGVSTALVLHKTASQSRA